jgi:hypothetical protein
VRAFEVLVASPRSAGSYSKQGDPRDALLYRPASDVPCVPRAFFWGLAWIVGIFRVNAGVEISGSVGDALWVAVAGRFDLQTASEPATFSSMNYSSLR